MPPAEPVRYAVDLSDRVQHLVGVRMRVPADVAAGARLVLPTWTPGSYVIRNYVHHVQRIAACGADGAPLDLQPDGVSAWRLPAVDGPADVELELYANDLTVRTNHVDDHHALLVAPACFPYVEGATDRPHQVTLAAADGERVFSLLPQDGADTYCAADYDHLVDSAFEVGDLPSVDFAVAGVPHRLVWAGHGGGADLDRLARDAAAIGAAAVDLFGGDLPAERYTFLCVGWDAARGAGGLEHRDGAVVMVPVLHLHDPDRYARFQSLLAHEYLHLWNVKRLTPAALVAPDYEHPTHTTSLWVAEGWTDHYDDLLPLRAGVWSVRRFLDAQRDLIQQVHDTPGARLQSVRQASYEAWTKLYVRDENSLNLGVSYYGHGALLAWSLDLLIRREAPDGPGLDGVLRDLWRRFGTTRRGYTEDDVEAAVNAAAGRDLGGFFGRHVAGTALPPIEELVGVVGLRLVDDQEGGPPPPDLGVRTSEDDHGVTVAAVLRDRPAWRGGVTGGDRLVAIDGTTVGRGELDLALRAHPPGDTVTVSVLRGPRLLHLGVTLGEPRPRRKLTAVAQPDDDQRTAFRSWTGRDLADA